jgi:hypothetical protein
MTKEAIRYVIPVLFSLLISCAKKATVEPLDPPPNSTIVFIGNTFAESLQEHNYFETLLYQSFPERNLRVRNLAWSADEIDLQPRPVNFGTLDKHLGQQKADIIFACFGLNEAFKGPDSLAAFQQKLKSFLAHLQGQPYNGQSGPKLVLVSPIAHEALGGFLPDPTPHNESLKQYTRAMSQVGKELGIPFIDLYQPTAERMQNRQDALTTNGIHLNDRGYRLVSELMAQALGFPVSAWRAEAHLTRLQDAIALKNRHFFYQYKAGNGEYIYGRRKTWAGGQALPVELTQIGTMVRRLDSLIWMGSQDATQLDGDRVLRVVRTAREPESQPVASARNLPPVDKSTFVLPEGYQIEAFATELEFPIANPVSFTFDPQGRMWVATMPSYPHYSPGHPPDDKIIILEDTDRDGKADKHTVFADSLYLPLGFELGNGGAYVSQAPDLIFLKDTDGDGRADLRQTLLRGFGTEDSHHAISAFAWGPDGALYMHEGTFLHSQVETPYGP